MTDSPDLFISRAGPDADIAAEIAAIVESAGHRAILQQWDFANRNFMSEMHSALASGSRVIALLSPEYLRSEHCAAEWMSAIADDPLNKKGRLIVFRVAECAPIGLLSAIAYWDLVPIRSDRTLLAGVVLGALRGNHHDVEERPATYWREARVILDPDAILEPATFTGRENELTAIDEAFREAGRVAITGLPGVGKSSLARAYAWKRQANFSIVWWLNAESEQGLVDGFVRLGRLFVRDLDEAKNRDEAARRIAASVFSGFDKPGLLILDNLEDESLLSKWLPRENVRALITSRNAAWMSDVATVPLEAWSVADAAAYLERESGRRDITGEAAAKIAAELGGLPLALSHAAAYLRRTRTVSADRYLERLAEHMAQAPRGVDYPQAVFATFRAAALRAEEESPGSIAVLCLSSFFAPDEIPEALFTADLGDAVAALRPPLPDAATLAATLANPGRIEENLGALDHFSLIAFFIERRRFAMHRLVQSACRALLESDVSAWVACAVKLVHAGLLDRDDAVKAIDADIDNIRHVLRWAITNRSDVGGGAGLLNRLSPFWQATGKYAEAHQWYESVLALSDLVPEGLYPKLLLDAAAVAIFRDDFGRSIELLEIALPMLAGPGDELARARALSTLATARYSSGALETVESLWRESLSILETEGHQAGMARVTGNLGLLAWQVHADHEEARRFYERGLDLARAAALPPLEALYLGNLGEIAFATGDVERAVALATQSRDMFRDLGNESFVADQLKLLAKYELSRSRTDLARDYLREALKSFDELDQDFEIAECLILAAEIAASEADAERGAKLFAFGSQLLDQGQRSVSSGERERLGALRDRLARELADRMESLEAEGRSLTRAQAIGYF